MSRHDVYYSRMFSATGWNVQYHCERVPGRLHEVINSSMKRTVLADVFAPAGMIQELVMVRDRDGLLCLSTDIKSQSNMQLTA